MTDDLLKRLAERERSLRAERDEEPALSSEAEDRIAQAILGQGKKPALRVVAGGADVVAEGAAGERDARETDALASTPREAPRWRRAAMLGGPLALAAAIALWVGTRSPAEDTIPPYELSMVSLASSRAVPAARDQLEVLVDPRGDFELVARPASPTPGVSARALLDDAAWGAPIDVSQEGSVRIAGTVSALFGDGRQERRVTLIVAPAADLPSEAAAVGISRGEIGAPTTTRVLRARVKFSATTP
jgi:hypothetical protein